MGYLIVIGLLSIIFLLAFWPMINYKMKADKLGVNISWGQVTEKEKKFLSDIATSIELIENLVIRLPGSNSYTFY